MITLGNILIFTLIFSLSVSLFDFHTHFCFQFVCGTTLAWLALALSQSFLSFVSFSSFIPHNAWLSFHSHKSWFIFYSLDYWRSTLPMRPLEPSVSSWTRQFPCDPLSPICPFLTSLPWGPCGPRTPGSPGIPFEAGMPGKPRPSIDFWNWRWFYHQVEYHHAWWSGWLNWTVVDCRWCSDDLCENSTLNEWWQGKQLILLPENLGDRGKHWDSRGTKLTVSRGTRVFKWYVI